ncbi:hypothetical protein Y032_0908g2990 [Ancylostoma ceylanicum]|uniref:Uncharacterized protein n=1 Tax=Ancylostoma ceylanicum TaxID=53326 RepID=A0A016W8Z5_9BILA|nr:hypothetical protein Y032_0908g2990 [Ancylostoma ceylanicum]
MFQRLLSLGRRSAFACEKLAAEEVVRVRGVLNLYLMDRTYALHKLTPHAMQGKMIVMQRVLQLQKGNGNDI